VKEVITVTDFTGGPGLAAFIATFSVVLVTLVLMRSLNKQLRKVRTSPPVDEGVVANATATALGVEDDDSRSGEERGEPGDR